MRACLSVRLPACLSVCLAVCLCVIFLHVCDLYQTETCTNRKHVHVYVSLKLQVYITYVCTHTCEGRYVGRYT